MAYGAGDKEQFNLMKVLEELWFFFAWERKEMYLPKSLGSLSKQREWRY